MDEAFGEEEGVTVEGPGASSVAQAGYVAGDLEPIAGAIASAGLVAKDVPSLRDGSPQGTTPVFLGRDLLTLKVGILDIEVTIFTPAPKGSVGEVANSGAVDGTGVGLGSEFGIRLGAGVGDGDGCGIYA